MNGYRAPWWLPGRHAQTLLPSLVASPCINDNPYSPRFFRWPCITYAREQWQTPPSSARKLRPDPPLRPEQLPDDDFIHVDSVGDESARNWIVLFHGLEGSSRSAYARKLARRALAEGWYLGMPHFRGCSGRPNIQLRDYHAGVSDEVDWIMRRFRARQLRRRRMENPPKRLFVVGVSLGANAVLKWLGQLGGEAAEIVQGAVSVSAPFDLRVTGAQLGRGFSAVYSKTLLGFNLRRKALDKLRRFPGAYDARCVRAAAVLRDFEDSVTAPVNGFRDVNDYYARASAGPWLQDIQVPTLVLNARNDPFLAEHVLQTVDRQIPQPSRYLAFEFPDEGGHAGFADGRGWLVNRIFEFLR